jgi:translocation and assembly module TamA
MQLVYLAFAMAFSSLSSLAAEPVEICAGFSIRGAEKIRLTESEKRLLCGDPQAKDWQSVPPSQALFSLRGFLQDRGYYYPIVTRNAEKVVVDIGKQTFVDSVVVSGGPPELTRWDRENSKGELLTPGLLRAVVSDLSARLGKYGYACPKVTSEADPQNGKVSIAIAPGEKQKLIRVKEEHIAGIAPGTLRRYDAFVMGDTYRGDLMPLTASRTVSDGIVRNSYFNVRCTTEGVEAQQKVLAGLPREVTLGFGFNTDRGLVTRGAWKHARLGTRGSQLATFLSASWKGRDFNTEEGGAELSWYLLEEPSRFHIRSLLNLKHQSDNRSEVVTANAQMAPAMTWDTAHLGGKIIVGPTLNGLVKLRGDGRDQTYFFALAGELRLTSHDYEWQRPNPKSGFELTSNASFSRKGLLADLSSTLFNVRYGHLFPFPAEGKKQLVLGVRSGFSTTVTALEEGGLGNLPTNLRHYLGGTTNLRGFAFLELPDANGGLTSVYASVEGRGVGLLPFQLEPYAFVDVGSVSRTSLDLTAPWYLSPGAGIRWGSMVGVFRVSIARGFALAAANQSAEHWQLHLSYGEEF